MDYQTGIPSVWNIYDLPDSLYAHEKKEKTPSAEDWQNITAATALALNVENGSVKLASNFVSQLYNAVGLPGLAANIDNLLSAKPNSNGPHVLVATVNVVGDLEGAIIYDQMYKQSEAFIDGVTQEAAGLLIGRKFMTGADKINALSDNSGEAEAAEDLAQVSWASTPQAAQR